MARQLKIEYREAFYQRKGDARAERVLFNDLHPVGAIIFSA